MCKVQSAVLFLVIRGSNGQASPLLLLVASVQPIRFSPLAVVSGRPAWPASAEPRCSSYSTWGQEKEMREIFLSHPTAAKTICSNVSLRIAALTWSRSGPLSWGRRWWRGSPKTAGRWWFSRGSALRGASRHTQRCVASGRSHCSPLCTRTHAHTPLNDTLPLVISRLSLRPPHRDTVTDGKSDMWSQKLSTPLSPPELTDCGDRLVPWRPGSEMLLPAAPPLSLHARRSKGRC